LSSLGTDEALARVQQGRAAAMPESPLHLRKMAALQISVKTFASSYFPEE
jgi:hypothetical protein